MGRTPGAKNKPKDNIVNMAAQFEPDNNETEEQRDARIRDRFDTLKIITDATAKGLNRSLIISGPSGLGKSYEVEKVLKASDSKFIMITGNVQPTGLYKTLFEHRDPGQVVVFDDSDGIFWDPLSLNLLKAASDTKAVRTLYWLSERSLKDTYSDPIPNSFEFRGSIIFITNYDFDKMINKEHKLTVHFQALMSRAHYLDMAIKTRPDYVTRIKQVLREGLLDEFTDMDQVILLRYLQDNMANLRELSVRIVIKIGQLIKMDKTNWRKLADTMCLKQK